MQLFPIALAFVLQPTPLVRTTAALVFLPFLLPLSAYGDDWVVSVGTGPFVFGSFAEHRERISVGGVSENLRHSVSAATRAGALVEVEYRMTGRLSLRTEATFTRSPLSIKTMADDDDPDSEGVTLDIGDLDVTTIALAVAYHFNVADNLLAYVAGGPAYAIYDLDPQPEADALFEGSRGRFGGLAAVGMEWWFNPNWRLRAEVADIITESPLERSDFGAPPPPTLEIDSPHNVHTSFGVGFRF